MFCSYITSETQLKISKLDKEHKLDPVKSTNIKKYSEKTNNSVKNFSIVVNFPAFSSTNGKEGEVVIYIIFAVLALIAYLA